MEHRCHRETLGSADTPPLRVAEGWDAVDGPDQQGTGSGSHRGADVPCVEGGSPTQPAFPPMRPHMHRACMHVCNFRTAEC